MNARRVLAAATGAVLAAGLTVAVPTDVAAAGPACTAYFDADGTGTDDLAIGTPGEDVEDAGVQLKDAGSVTIVGGDADGAFGHSGSSQITLAGLALPMHASDRFGAAVVTTDLDGDGCADLAVGAPGMSSGAGAVVVLWGSASGLDLLHPQVLMQGTAPVGSKAEAGDGFGSTLAAAGSLPTGGAAALWVGSPGEDVGSDKDAGMVTQLRTTAGGLLGSGGVSNIHQDSAGVPGAAEPGDRFGERLSGGARSLLVGVPHEDVGTLVDAGAYYSMTLSTGHWSTYTQDSAGVPGAAERYDLFGSSVAQTAGCSGATDETDAVGASGEDVGTLVNAGNVTLRDVGSGKGRVLQPGSGGVPGQAEAGDTFGAAMVDAGVLVIAAPGEDLGQATDAGEVTLVALECAPGGQPVPGVIRVWSQGGSGTPGSPEDGDRFGQALGSALVTVTGLPLQHRLVVGAPGESEGAVAGSGNVTVFGTAATELTTSGAVALGQASAVIADVPEAGDGFGGALDAANATAL